MADETHTEQQTETKAEVKAMPPTFRHILGTKLGMTQIFDGGGNVIPVTAVEAGPCTVVQVRTPQKDGYSAVQLGFGAIEERKISKPEAGRFKKLGVGPFRHLREFRTKDSAFEVGQSVTLEGRFKPGDYVDVAGVTKGKGFAGGVKRHNFRGLPASHGASDKERSPGSLASRRSLGRVLPGQRMAGHMGHERHSELKLEVAHVDAVEHLIYLRGAVPGPAGSLVEISETVKAQKHRIVRALAASKKKDPLKAAKQAAKGGTKK